MSNLAANQLLEQLKGKAGDKQTIYSNHSLCKTVAMRVAPETGDLVQVLQPLMDENVLDGTDVDEFLGKQRDRLKALAQANAQREQHVDTFVTALGELQKQLGENNNNSNDGDQLSIDYQAKIQELMDSTRPESLPAPSKEYLEEVMEQLGEETNQRKNDDDIQVMGGQKDASFKCPITAALLEEPMRNKQCGHVYSKDGIAGLMRGGSCRCPVPGCQNGNVRMNQLEKDVEMDTLVRRERRRLEMAKEQRASQAQMVDSDEEDDE